MSAAKELSGLDGLLKKSAEVSAAAQPQIPTTPIEPTVVKSATLTKSPTLVTFYSRLDGSRYIFADGGVAIFTGGVFEFDPQNPDPEYVPPEGKGTVEECWDKRFKELQYVCKVQNPVFSAVPVAVQRSDSRVLREVGHAGGGIGIIGSTQLQDLMQR